MRALAGHSVQLVQLLVALCQYHWPMAAVGVWAQSGICLLKIHGIFCVRF